MPDLGLTRRISVSVVIPTLNSEATIGLALQSVRNQSYGDIETIVVDSYSRDSTREIAKTNGASVILTRARLLGARYLGTMRSKGEFVLVLDSDQILERTAVERAIRLVSEGPDMLVLEESAFRPATWVQKLFEADRDLVHKLSETNMDPTTGVLLARFFRRSILEEAFRRIPAELLASVVFHDHSIIYYESFKISQRVGLLHNAVWHMEPASLAELWRKNFRYGRSAYGLASSGHYRELVWGKTRFRARAPRSLMLGLQSDLLTALKGLPYFLGYASGGLASLGSKVDA